MITFKLFSKLIAIVALLLPAYLFGATLASNTFDSSNDGWLFSNGGWDSSNQRIWIDSSDTASKIFSLGASYANSTVFITLNATKTTNWEDADHIKITANGSSVYNSNAAGFISFSATLDALGQLAIIITPDTSKYNEDLYIDNVFIYDVLPIAIGNFRNFTKRTSFFAQGKMVSIGNTFTVAPFDDASSANCNTYTNGTYYDPITDNNARRRYCHYNVDGVQGSAATRAQLIIPSGSTIKWAGLYWQALTPHRSNSYDTMSINIRNDANGTAYQNVPVTHVDYQSNYSTDIIPVGSSSGATSADLYSAFADVTSLFKNQGWLDGNYTVSTPDVMEGRESYFGVYGAWNLVVIYANNAETYKSFTIFDGWKKVSGATGFTDVPVTVSGFYTPKSTPINARVAVFAAEGDYSLNGDKLQAIRQSDGATVEFLNSNNPSKTDQTFSSLVNTTGAREPSQQNNNGIDIQTFDVGTGTTYNLLQTQQTSMLFHFTSNQDLYFPSILAFSTEIYTPKMCYDYSLKQDGQYLNIDRYSYPIARIDSKVSSSDIGVTIYLKNKEADIAADGISIKSDANASMFDQTGHMYSSNVNGSALLDRGVPTTTTPLCDYNVSVDNSTSNNGCTDGHNVRKGLGTLGAQNYVYAKYTVKPSGVSGITDINESLGLSVDYYIDINGSVITYNDYTLGGSNVPLCPPSSAYTPTWGQFNVVESGLKTNNLNTQISRKAFNTDVIFDSDTTTGKNDAPSTDINTTVLTEIIDVDAFGDLNASCANPDSSVSTPIFVPISFTPSNYQTPIPAQTDDYYNFAVKNAALRVWYFTDDNGTLIQNWNAATTNNNKTLSSISGLYDPATHTACTSDCTDPTSTTCFTCIKNNYAKPLCSRDNFSVRPESYDMRVYDVNNSLSTYDITTDPTNPKNTTKIDLSNLYHYDPLHAAATGRIDLAAGYAYRFDMNATGHNGISSVPGYTRYFNGDSDYNITEIWDPQSAVTGCNDTSNVNMPLYIANGVAQNNERTFNNVGEYRLNIVDTSWTAVDWQNLTHHDTSTDGGFLAGTDCIPNSNSSTLVGDEYGCTITSNHGADGGGRVYKDNDLTFHPYEFAVSNTVTLGRGNSGAGVSPAIMPEPSKPFVYMSNLSQDENMSVHLNTTVTARGRNSAAGLSNYVTGCFSKPINLTIAKTATTNPALTYNYWVHNKDINGTVIPANDINKTIIAGNTIENPAFTTTSSFFQKDQNGTVQLLTNLNYKRDVNVTTNPEDINFTTISTDDNATLINADLVANKYAEGNTTVNQRVLYYYGRTIAPKITVVCNSNTCRTGISATNNNNIKELISYAIYCQGATCNSTILPIGALQVGDIRWFENRNHDKSGQPLTTDGNIGTVTEVSNTGNVSEISRAISQINYENEDVIEYTGSLPYDAIMQMQSSPWLIYNENDANATTNQFIIQFVGDGGWSGKHEDNTTTKTNFSTKTNRRIMW